MLVVIPLGAGSFLEAAWRCHKRMFAHFCTHLATEGTYQYGWQFALAHAELGFHHRGAVVNAFPGVFWQNHAGFTDNGCRPTAW